MTKPVDRYLQILRIIERENQTGIGVNKIIGKTGSTDKQRIINYMRDLEREKIIETKSSSAHQQTKFKRLTDLGWELVRLSHNIDRYIDSCSEVRRATKEKFYVKATGDFLDRILRDSASPEDELHFETQIKGMVLCTPLDVINVILTKYIITLYKFKLKENEIGKLILDKIVMNAVYTQFSIEADILSHRIRPNDLVFDMISYKVGNSILGFALNKPFDNRFIATKAKHVLESTFSLLDVSNEIIRKEIKFLHDIFKKNLDDKSNFGRGLKEVFTVCEEYMNKST